MNIQSIINFNFIPLNKTSNRDTEGYKRQYQLTQIKPLSSDIFVKNSKISFTSNIADEYEFETTYNKAFFKKILKEGIKDAYSDITLIPQEEIDFLKSKGVLNKKSSVAVKALKKYKSQMFPIEKDIFLMLEKLSKKNPNLTLQELLKLKYVNAEHSLINQQSKILDKINLIIRTLPKNEYHTARKLINESFDKIFEPDPIPEMRFGRKNFIIELRKLPISDEKIKKKILAIAETLPQSTNSINAFIVKYCQPYKLRYNNETKTYTRIPRTSEEIGLRLLEPSIGTDDHIHPQEAFRQEALARQNGDEEALKLSKLRVTILTSRRMNELKTNNSIDDFIKANDPNIKTHIQNHINQLIDITNKWSKNGKTLSDANKLADYIILLKNELETRSHDIQIDLGNFEKVYTKTQESNNPVEIQPKRKRLKKSGHAANTHKEKYIEKNGNIIENRKVQKHNPRFNP